MYLPRNHHHKVWRAPGTGRTLLLLVDNPPTSVTNVVWIETVHKIQWHREQVKTALRVGERCEAASAGPVNTASSGGK